MAKSDAIVHPKKAAFLAAYREMGNIAGAARAAEVGRQTHYEWLGDPDYAREFADAKEDAIEHLEEVARSRAKAGSDTLMIFLLKSLRPEVYRDRVTHQHEGSILHRLQAMTVDELAEIEGMDDDQVIKLLADGSGS